MKDLVNYNQALELKELGFDEPCFVKVWWLNSVHYQTKEPFKPHITMNGHDIKFEYPIPEKHPSTGFDTLDLQVPTFSQAFRFLRINYDLFCGILTECSYGGVLHAYHITGVNQGDISKGDFYSYETAESASLDKLIEIIKSKLP